MAHSNVAGSTTTTDKIISSIKLPSGEVYEVHDPSAIHDVSELGLSAALVFKGTKTSFDALPSTGNKVGDVWLIPSTSQEYVWTDNGWEPLGSVHDAASTTHKHNVVSLSGTNEDSDVTGKVVIPTYTTKTNYIKATISDNNFSKTKASVLSGDAEFSGAVGSSKVGIVADVTTNAAVGADGTAKAITGFGTHSQATVIKSLNTTSINNPTATNVSIPNVTSNTDVTASKVTVTEGTAPTWSASVSDAGVLSFSFIAGTTPPIVTKNDVTASKVALGTAISASKVTTEAVTVATGTASQTATAITALGTPSTATVLTGVKVTAQPKVTIKEAEVGDVNVVYDVPDNVILTPTGTSSVSVLSDVSVSSQDYLNISISGEETSGAQTIFGGVTIGSTTVNITEGKAKAQKWTFNSGTTGTPIE